MGDWFVRQFCGGVTPEYSRERRGREWSYVGGVGVVCVCVVGRKGLWARVPTVGRRGSYRGPGRVPRNRSFGSPVGRVSRGPTGVDVVQVSRRTHWSPLSLVRRRRRGPKLVVCVPKVVVDIRECQALRSKGQGAREGGRRCGCRGRDRVFEDGG